MSSGSLSNAVQNKNHGRTPFQRRKEAHPAKVCFACFSDAAAHTDHDQTPERKSMNVNMLLSLLQKTSSRCECPN